MMEWRPRNFFAGFFDTGVTWNNNISVSGNNGKGTLGPGFGNRRAQRLDRSQHRLQTADLLDIALAADQQVHQAGRQGELLPQGQRQPANDRLRRLVDHVSAAVEYAQRGRPVVQGGLQEMGAAKAVT